MTQAQTMTYELMHMPMTLTLIQIIFINESSHKSSNYYSYSIIRFDSDSYWFVSSAALVISNQPPYQIIIINDNWFFSRDLALRFFLRAKGFGVATTVFQGLRLGGLCFFRFELWVTRSGRLQAISTSKNACSMNLGDPGGALQPPWRSMRRAEKKQNMPKHSCKLCQPVQVFKPASNPSGFYIWKVELVQLWHLTFEVVRGLHRWAYVKRHRYTSSDEIGKLQMNKTRQIDS